MALPAGNYISLFAGVGGLDLGLRISCPQTRCVGYVEINVEAAEVLAARIEEGSLDSAPVWSDVRTFSSELYRGRVAGLIAGFPCPDYSVAGKRAGIVGKHGQLWDDLAAVIRDVGPEWLVLENVPGIFVPHSADGGAVLPAGLHFVLGDLASLGFNAEWLRLRASDVGASHGRARWFCLAYRKGGRLGIVRESSGRDGFTDRSNAAVAHCGHIADSHEYSQAGNGRGDSFGGGGQMADASRNERRGSHRKAGARRGVCETSDELDNAASPRLMGWRSEPSQEIWDGARWGESCGRCDGLADPECAQRRQGDEPAGCGRKGINRERQAPSPIGVDGAVLGDSDQPGLQGRRERGHGPDERAFGAAGDPELADTGRERDERRREPGELAGAGGWPESETHQRERRGYAACDSLPIFAPGPGATELWQDLLVRYPWLRPAISQAEAERLVCDLDDGMASTLAGSRTDQLRAGGNGVVSLQAACAIVELAERANANG